MKNRIEKKQWLKLVKRGIVFAICLCMLIILAGCGSKDPETKAADAVGSGEQAVTVAEETAKGAVVAEETAKGAVVAEETAEGTVVAEETAEGTVVAEETAEGVQETVGVDTTAADVTDAGAEGIGAVSGELSSPEAGMLTFRDVFGTEYEVEINTQAKATPYDKTLFSHEGSFISYTDDAVTCVPGIDVSAYQGDIDWQTVKAQGFDFAFIRIGFRGYGEEGTLVADEAAAVNIAGAKEAGMSVGVYFFSQAVNEEEAIEEADYVAGLLQGEELDLPIVYDAEHIRDDVARTDDVDGAQFTKNAKAFCERVKENGYQPMIYSNMMWEAFEYDMAELSAYPFWYADYEDVPQTPYLFDFWQYSESGNIDGIEGPVDLDVWMQR